MELTFQGEVEGGEKKCYQTRRQRPANNRQVRKINLSELDFFPSTAPNTEPGSSDFFGWFSTMALSLE